MVVVMDDLIHMIADLSTVGYNGTTYRMISKKKNIYSVGFSPNKSTGEKFKDNNASPILLPFRVYFFYLTKRFDLGNLKSVYSITFYYYRNCKGEPFSIVTHTSPTSFFSNGSIYCHRHVTTHQI